MAVPNLTANSPTTGSIAWSAFSIQYGGIAYSVPTGSSALKYVYWLYGGGSPSINASDTLPTLGADDLLLFVNKAGIPINVPASNVVDGSLIVDGTIVGSALIANTVHGDRIQAGTIDAAQIKAGAIVASKIAAKQIDVSKMVITSFDNLVGDPNFLLGTNGWSSINGGFITNGGEGGRTNAAVLLPNTVTQYPVAQPTWSIETENGASYRTRVKFHTDIDLPAGVVVIRVRFTATDGSIVDVTGGTSAAATAGSWNQVSGMVTVPSDKTYVTAGFFFAINPHATQTIKLSEPSMVRAASANLIVDGSIDAIKVRANSIDVSKLTIASFENFLADPTFQLNLGDPGGWAATGGTGFSVAVTGSRSGGRAAQIINSNANQNLVNGTKNMPVEPGDVFNLSAWVRQTTDIIATRVYFTTEWKLANGTSTWLTVPCPAIAANTWARMAGKVTAPASAVTLAQVILVSGASNTTGNLLVDFVQGVRAASGELIVDGSIVTAKLDAEAVTAAKIAADAVTADKIKAGEVVAGKLAASAVTTENLAAEAVTADKIKVGTLEAGFVLSGRIQVGQQTWTPTEGLVIPQPGGGRIHLPADGVTPATFDGHVTAQSATIRGNLNIMGASNKINGSVTLSAGVTEPTVAPSAWATWSAAYSSTLDGSSVNWRMLTHMAPHHSNVGRFASALNYGGATIRTYDVATAVWQGDVANAGGWGTGFVPYGLAQAGGFYYIYGSDSNRSGGYYIYKIRGSDGVKVGELYHGDWMLHLSGTPAIFTDGTRVYVVFTNRLNSDITRMNHWTVDLSPASGQSNDIPSIAGKVNFTGAQLTAADTGTSRIWLMSEDHRKVFAINASTLEIEHNYSFQVIDNRLGRGIMWDTVASRFKGIDRDGYLTTYSSRPLAQDVTVSNTWYDGAGTVRETREGPATTFTLPPRTWLGVQTTTPPDSGNVDALQVDKANRTGVYVGVGAGARRLQAYLGVDGAGQSIRIMQMDAISTSSALTPGANTFIGGNTSTGKLVSGATLSGQPAAEFSGDGSIKSSAFFSPGYNGTKQVGELPFGILPLDGNVSQTGASSTYLKRNGFVFVGMEFAPQINYQNGWGIGTLPVGFRPYLRTWFPVSAAGVTYLLLVDTNGVISNQGATIPATYGCLGSVVFPVPP